MKLFGISIALACLAGLSFAQTEPNQSAVENAPVLDEVVNQRGNDTLVIQRIEQPEFLEDEGSPEEQTEAPVQQSILPVQTYVIAATSFGPGATRLQIWPSNRGQNDALEGWTNIDWSVLQSLLSFDTQNVRYQFMLFYSGSGQGADSPEIPQDLPEFTETGARYLMTLEENAQHEATLDFLEAVHALYDDSREQLHANRAVAIERQEERLRQIEIEAAQPKTRVLKIWRHTRPEEDPSE